jgi:glucose/arabinose dehydrogenase
MLTFGLLIYSNPHISGSADSDTNYNPDKKEPKLEDDSLKIQKIYEGLDNPTGMAFLHENDILVLQKNNGTIYRILNGTISERPLVDVSVANYVERGLLGIVIGDKNFSNKKIDKSDNRPYIYLYYTESPSNSSSNTGQSNDCTLCDPIGHRLYRYELQDDKLISRHLILDLPSSPGPYGSSHVGGALVIGPDKKIYLTTGDGQSCRNNSCKEGIQNKVINSQSANIIEGRVPEGRGGILRVDQGVTTMHSKGILGDQYPLSLYYAYGMRNSFGIDFDPVSGNLWDTENGPAFGDEINLVKAGFNSGWARIQGMWPINDYGLLDSTTEQKGYFRNTEKSNSDKLVTFDRKGKYSPPELALNQTEGLTSIKFFNSDKLGKQYENDMFVGDVVGHLFHFELNDERTELDLKGNLSDKVANSPNELKEVILGRIFQPIVDIEISPDGYLYILSYDGSIYKISKR